MTDYADQQIRSQMRFCLIQNLLRRSGLYKKLQHFPVPPCRVFHQRIQLSVRKSTCTALSELYIGLGIKNPKLPEILHGSGALSCALSPFQKDRRISCPGEHQSAEQPRRACPDDDRTVGKLLLSRMRKLITGTDCSGHLNRSFLQNRLFVFDVCINHIDIFQPFPAGIQRFFDNLIAGQIPGTDPQYLSDFILQILHGMRYRKLQLMNS